MTKSTRTRARCMGALLALVGAVTCISAPGAAHAQDFPKVFILPVLDLPGGVVETGAKDLTTQLLERFKGSIPVTVVTDLKAVKLPTDFGDAAEAGDERTAADGKKLLTEGKKLKTKDAAKAIERLKAAVGIFERLLPETHDFASLAEAHLELGDALFRDGLQDEGEERAKIVASMGFVPKKLAGLDKLYAGVLTKNAEKMLSKAPGSISVSGDPAKATVWIDGKERGESPVKVSELAPGIHYVLVEAGGFGPKVEKVDVVGNETSELTVKLVPEGTDEAASGHKRLPGPLNEAIGAGRIGSDARGVLAGFGKAADVQFVVLAYLVPDGDVFFFRPYMFRVEDKALAEMDRKIFPSLDKTGKGIEETAAAIIKWAYAFPGDLVPVADTVVIPVPEVKVAKIKTKSSIVETKGSGKYAEDCDPDIEDCPESKKPTAHKVSSKRRKGVYDPDIGCNPDKLDDVELEICLDAELEWLETCDSSEFYCDDIAKENASLRAEYVDGDGGGGGGGTIKLPGVFKKWWFWTAIGVVAVGGITTGIILGTRNGINAIVTWR